MKTGLAQEEVLPTLQGDHVRRREHVAGQRGAARDQRLGGVGL